MMRTFLGAAILALAAFPSASSANMWMWRRPATVSTYYYPAPISYTITPVVSFYQPYLQPAFEPIAVCPPPPCTVEPPRYAVPTPAPASSAEQKAPPLAAPTSPPKQSPPSGHQSLKAGDRFYDVFFVGPANQPSSTEGGCSVAFWNLSNENLAVMIAGESWTIPSGQSVRLKLPHEFAWRVQGREAELGRIPAKETGAEFVIRR